MARKRKGETAPELAERTILETLQRAPELGLGEQGAKLLAKRLVEELDKSKIGFHGLT